MNIVNLINGVEVDCCDDKVPATVTIRDSRGIRKAQVQATVEFSEINQPIVRFRAKVETKAQAKVQEKSRALPVHLL